MSLWINQINDKCPNCGDESLIEESFLDGDWAFTMWYRVKCINNKCLKKSNYKHSAKDAITNLKLIIEKEKELLRREDKLEVRSRGLEYVMISVRHGKCGWALEDVSGMFGDILYVDNLILSRPDTRKENLEVKGILNDFITFRKEYINITDYYTSVNSDDTLLLCLKKPYIVKKIEEI